MKTMVNLVKYHFLSYFKSNKIVMPFASFIAVLFVLYSVSPLGVVSSFTISCILVFLIMTWVGITYSDLEDPVAEQIMILKIQSERKYYSSSCVFLFLLGMAAALIGIFVPVVKNISSQNHLFLRDLTFGDLLGGFLLQVGAAFVGTSTGTVLHPRIMKDRKISIALTAFITLAAIVKVSVIEKMPFSAFVMWAMPPISEMTKMFYKVEYYTFFNMTAALGMLLIYGVLVSGLKVWLLIKNKF